MKPIYEPKGKAKEYGDLAINIYTGCPHRCFYCYAPNVLHCDKETFHSNVEPRPGIVEAVKAQLEREQITGKLIHLCFTCDPYPTGYDSTPTREIIKLLKAHGNHVQILTKGLGDRDFDLLDSNDRYGITLSTGSNTRSAVWEPGSAHPSARLISLLAAKKRGISTWVSMEPVLDESVLDYLEFYPHAFDLVKIGKLNYHPSDINWSAFGLKAEEMCKTLGIDYYIKESLRAEMEGSE